jgi:hypothetical protein
MAAGSVEKDFTTSADDVWAVIGDFYTVDAIFQGLDSFERDGDDRIIGMFGLKIRERLLEHDDAARRLVYEIVEGVPVDSHRGTITVAEAGPGCTVTWAYEVTPDEMADLMGGTYAGALEQLKAHFGEA